MRNLPPTLFLAIQHVETRREHPLEGGPLSLQTLRERFRAEDPNAKSRRQTPLKEEETVAGKVEK